MGCFFLLVTRHAFKAHLFYCAWRGICKKNGARFHIARLYMHGARFEKTSASWPICAFFGKSARRNCSQVREDPPICRECDQEAAEGEMHFMCRCLVYSTLRERLYGRLEMIYPGWHMILTSLPDNSWRVVDLGLLWHIPGGITPAASWLQNNIEQREERRVLATRATVSYLAEAHKVNPGLKRQMP